MPFAFSRDLEANHDWALRSRLCRFDGYATYRNPRTPEHWETGELYVWSSTTKLSSFSQRVQRFTHTPRRSHTVSLVSTRLISDSPPAWVGYSIIFLFPVAALVVFGWLYV